MKKSLNEWVPIMASLGALAVALGCVAYVVFQKRSPRIVYAETSVVMAEFNESIKAKKAFEEAQKDWDKNLKTLNDSLMSMMEKMKTGYDAAEKKQQEVMRDELRRRNEDLQNYTNSVKKLSQDKERELMDPVIKKINGFVTLWGKQKGYDMILGTLSGGNILQADSDLNVTAGLLHDLNEHYRDLPVSESEKPASARLGSASPGAVPPVRPADSSAKGIAKTGSGANP